MADTVIENLITKLSFDFDEDTLDKFDDTIESAVKGLTLIVAGATAAATAIFAFTKSVADSNDELGKFARRIGVDVGALQELGFVAELQGGSIDSMNSSLENLSRISSEAARGIGAGVEAFGILGVSVTTAMGEVKTADDLLFDVADAIARVGSQAERLELAQKLGIGGDLLLAIQQGSEAIREQRKEARELGFVIDEDATKAAADFNDELLRQAKIINGIASAIGTRLMKQLTPMTKQFVEWFKINREIIQQNISSFLDKAIVTIRAVFNIVSRVTSMVLSLVNAMGGWENSIKIVTALLLAMNASALLMPILAIAAGAGILLLLEDFITFLEGGDSALGELAKDSEVLTIALQDLGWLLKTIAEGWRLLFTDGDKALEGLIMMIEDVGKAIDNFLIGKLKQAISLINKIPGVDVGEVSAPIDTSIIGTALEAITPLGLFSLIREQISRASDSLAGPTMSRSNTTNNNSSPNINISINGGDTERVRQTVLGVLNEQYSGAETNLQSQVEF